MIEPFPTLQRGQCHKEFVHLAFLNVGAQNSGSTCPVRTKNGHFSLCSLLLPSWSNFNWENSDLILLTYTVRKKRNLTARKVQNIFSLLRGVNSFWHYEAELQYQYSFGKKNCLTIIGKKLFATPGPLSFFF